MALLCILKRANFIFLLLCLLVLLFLVSDSLRAAADKPLTIAFVPRSLDNPIFLDTFEEAQEKAHELGVRLEWVAPFTFSNSEQVEVIENLIRRKVDGMVLSVDDIKPIRQVISKAIRAGIPVATFDADSPGSERLFYIGIDNTKAGFAIGQALVDVVKKRGLADQELNTMIMTGARDALNLQERIRGFKEATAGEINLNIRAVLENQDNIKISIELTEDYVKNHPELDVIFFVGGWPFYVPAEAMINFQHWAQKGGIAVGIDIFYDALLLQKEGLIQYLVGQDLGAMGSQGLEYMVNYIKHNKRPPTFIETGLNHAGNDNLEYLLEVYKPWRVK
ncbi:sugar ABC transporter substrate-binding protein [Halocella sp. SP3-1]|nr:sugar ABC transporter substrate-binding protein [Halocella sp. SP3-1]